MADSDDTPVETPIPEKVRRLERERERALDNTGRHEIHVVCKHVDAEVLMDDVRQTRKWRTWLVTGGIVFVAGVLITVFGWLFAIGTEVGAAERDRIHNEEDIERARVERNDLRREHLAMEKANALRFEQIKTGLNRIELKVGKLEQQVEDITPARRRR